MKNKNSWSAAAVVAYCCLTMACSSSEQKGAEPVPRSSYVLPYHLHKPDTVLPLPSVLREISGLALAPDGVSLLAINDEQGAIFFLNPNTAAIERTHHFGEPGDYEGIEAVGEDIYVVKSNGTLYRIPASGATETFATPLNTDYDVEGLCYDSAQHCLLLACKGKAGRGSAYKGKKALYAFDLDTKKLNDTPVLLVDQAELARLKGGDTGFIARLLAFFSSKHAATAFGPSGLAISPLDGNLYIVSFAGKTLAVVHPDGRLLHAERLDPDVFRQPEGLCFDRAGQLYIASEGGKGEGRLLRFEAK